MYLWDVNKRLIRFYNNQDLCIFARWVVQTDCHLITWIEFLPSTLL